MFNKKFLFIAMLIVAIVAVGSVSAADDVAVDIDEPADDIEIDDVAADETDEVNEDSVTYVEEIQITTSSNISYYSEKLGNGELNNRQFNFAEGNYSDFSMFTGNNTKFVGNGATLIGSSDNLFKIANSHNVIITGFNMHVATGKAAIYGANVNNTEITNNNITGGKDGINIMQTHDNITISGNTITNFTRDGISLVDHRSFDDLSGKGNSIISNNIIYGFSIEGTEVGMFFGGNFKGNISGNVITNVATGVEFTGKKALSNGRLFAEFHNNTISNVSVGLYMNNHNIDYLNITNCNIGLNSSNITYAINAPLNHRVTGYLGVYNSNFNGTIVTRFINSVGNNYGNNTGFP